MESLRRRHEQRLSHTPLGFRRYLYPILDRDERTVMIKGSRGVGKTTMMLQHIKESQAKEGAMLYASLDELLFRSRTLVDIAEEFYLLGGRHLFLDEVHKYPDWSTEIKLLHDTYRDLRIVFTGSSLIELAKGDADLSRRAVSHSLVGLSFREYLALKGILKVEPIRLDELCSEHVSIARELCDGISIIKHFKEYLRHGYYPFFLEGEESFHQKLAAVVNLVIETDIPAAFNSEYQTVHKLKRLLALIIQSVPFKPNISELSRHLNTTSRSSTLQFLDQLQGAELIALLRTQAGGKGVLTKPDKIFLDNTSIMYALRSATVDIGNLRETFFYNQLRAGHSVTSPVKGDFMVDGQYTFEIGGKNKRDSQIKNIENSFVAADNLEIGFHQTIPLWLFGFLY